MDGEKPFVYVRRGESIERRDVELGRKSDTHVVVVSGLNAGDEVLLESPPAPSA
jgi:multidrug efflux pump subunit AcrA (membrane-fusion protein)